MPGGRATRPVHGPDRQCELRSRRWGNYSSFARRSRLPSVASNKRTDVATQTPQNAKVEGAGVPETDNTATRLEEILESMQVNPPADVTPPADEVGDDSQSSG